MHTHTTFYRARRCRWMSHRRSLRSIISTTAITKTMKLPEIPSTMMAAQGADYGDPDSVLTVQAGIPVPKLAEAVPDAKKRRTSMVIRTLAVALAPGDCRVMSGKTREFQGPPSFPYIPGGDCSGIVVEVPENDENDDGDCYFQIGDFVAVRFDGVPRGALAEYAVVSQNVCDKVPRTNDGSSFVVSPEEAAALASASPATLLADRVVDPQRKRPRESPERILVLGANGGQGSHLCQHLRRDGTSVYVVGVSNEPRRLLEPPISCDEAFDYTKDDVWTHAKFLQEPFDTVIDLACGGWPRIVAQSDGGRRPSIVKPAVDGGRYLTMGPDQATFEAHSVWRLLNLYLFPMLWRAASSRTWRRGQLPGYSFVSALPDSRDVITRTLSLAKEGQVRAVVAQGRDDGSSSSTTTTTTTSRTSFPFTTQGVRDAFALQESRHAKGKVVVRVSDWNPVPFDG